MKSTMMTQERIGGGSLSDCDCEDSNMWRRQMSLKDYPDIKEELICFKCGARWFI